MRRRRSIFWSALVVSWLCGCALGGELRTCDTTYYVIRTDLEPAEAREASLRMTRIFEEYRSQTRGFSGDIHEKFRCFLYSSREDYQAAGGPAKSTGIYLDDLKTLMAYVGDHPGPAQWGVLQHEAFHQFAAAVIRADLPTWLNEGIAEYFAECRFTGDGFFAGLAPADRIARLKRSLETNKLRSLPQLINLTKDQWAGGLKIENYDEAWSIVYFLLRADDGKYAPSLSKFVTLLGQGTKRDTAWRQCFGDMGQFESRWKSWWQNAPDDLTADEAVEADTQTFCSFLARTAIPKEGFSSFDAFVEAAATPRLGADWLPPALLSQTVESEHDTGARFSISQRSGESTKIVAECRDGTCVMCWFVGHGSKPKILTDFDNLPAIVGRAQRLSDAGHRDEARQLLLTSLKAHPKSTGATAARTLLKQLNP